MAFKAVGGITGEVTGGVEHLMLVMQGEIRRQDMQAALGLLPCQWPRESVENSVF
jgi:hypothetical protein